ncbi:hypothetical protein D3C77_641280 [compost metagenome]
MDNRRHHAAYQHQQNGETIELEAGNAQGREETRANLNTDGVHKQDQTELLNKVQHVAVESDLVSLCKVPDDDATEQDAAYP